MRRRKYVPPERWVRGALLSVLSYEGTAARSDELCAVVVCEAPPAARREPSPETAGTLEHVDRDVRAGELGGAGETGDPRADDRDLGLLAHNRCRSHSR